MAVYTYTPNMFKGEIGDSIIEIIIEKKKKKKKHRSIAFGVQTCSEQSE